MIRLQDIAEMAGVSRTTVSNVINGNTKRVSQKTIDKITTILKEQNYVPHMGSVMLSGHGSRIIGVVLGFSYAHGMQSLQDPFVGELIGTIQMETEENGYYVMLIGGESIQNVRSENTCIPVDIRKHCLLRKRRETVITIGGWDSNRRWKNRGDSAAAPDI